MDKNMTYEQAIKELEEIVKKLENPQTQIDKAFELYETGLKLSKFCEEYLSEKEKLLGTD